MSLLKKNGNETAPVVQAAPEPQEKEYMYALIGIDNINLNLAGETVQACLGRVVLNQAQHDELQALIKKGRPDITAHLRLIDIEEAEKVARDHLASVRRQAARGSSSTQERHDMIAEIAKDRTRNLDVVEEEAFHADDGPLKILD